MDWYKTAACQEIDNQTSQLWKLGDRLWCYSELKKTPKHVDLQGKSVKCITRLLKKNNFHLTFNLKGMPMTFKAEYGVPSSPGHKRANVAFVCRYNVAGKQSQIHGNNLVSEVAVAAALGVKAVLQLSCPTIGKVTVIGCPDTIKGDLATLVNLKVFQGMDVVMMAVPGPRTDWCAHFLARKTFRATYKGRVGKADLSVKPIHDQDACLLAYQNVMATQRHFARGWKAQVTMGRTGRANECQTVVRATTPSNAELFLIEQRILPCLEAAAEVSGATYEVDISQKTYHSMENNKQLCYMLQLNAYHTGTLATPLKAKPIMEPIDVANVSHVIPTLMPMFYFGEDADVGTPEFNTALRSQKAQDNTLSMAKALAMTAIDVLVTPAVLARVKDELCKTLAMEKNVRFKPLTLLPSTSKLIHTDMPFDSNTGWSKQL